MANDYYDDGPTQAKPEPEKSDERAGEDEGQTALLPEGILGGKKFAPGDEVVLRIVAVHEGELEVAYASEGKDEDRHEAESESPDIAGPGGPAPEPSMMD